MINFLKQILIVLTMLVSAPAFADFLKGLPGPPFMSIGFMDCNKSELGLGLKVNEIYEQEFKIKQKKRSKKTYLVPYDGYLAMKVVIESGKVSYRGIEAGAGLIELPVKALSFGVLAKNGTLARVYPQLCGGFGGIFCARVIHDLIDKKSIPEFSFQIWIH